MSAQPLYIRVIVLLLFIVVVVFTLPSFLLKTVGECEVKTKFTSIKDVCKRDLTYIGKYDERLKVSIQNWVYQTLCICVSMEAIKYFEQQLFLNLKDCYDPSEYIKNGIMDAIDKFQDEIDEAEESDMPVKHNSIVGFNPTFAYLPKNIRYNDYINKSNLTSIPDDLLEKKYIIVKEVCEDERELDVG